MVLELDSMGQIDCIAQEIECALATDDVLAKPIQYRRDIHRVRYTLIGNR